MGPKRRESALPVPKSRDRQGLMIVCPFEANYEPFDLLFENSTPKERPVNPQRNPRHVRRENPKSDRRIP